MSNHVKTENPDFNVFSVEHLDEAEPFSHIKSEPRVSIIKHTALKLCPSLISPLKMGTNDHDHLSSCNEKMNFYFSSASFSHDKDQSIIQFEQLIYICPLLCLYFASLSNGSSITIRHSILVSENTFAT